MLFANGDTIPNMNSLIRLYVHEASRVYCDKLVNFEDKKIFDQFLREALRKNIPVICLSFRIVLYVKYLIQKKEIIIVLLIYFRNGKKTQFLHSL